MNTDNSNNRFNNMTTTNPFMSEKFGDSRESNMRESNMREPNVGSRWGDLSIGDEEDNRSPRNSFQRGKFGPDKDRYGNYRKPTFKRTTRPKTPPPPTFNLKETDFPTLG